VTAAAYGAAAERWARGATLVYAPVIAELVAACPRSLTGHLVLDVGAGTGAATEPLRRRGARIVAADLSPGMLAWRREQRPPAVAADVRALPLGDGAVDDVVAAFVLNHVTDPERALAELRRVTSPGGALLAAVFAADFSSPLREHIDAVAADAGWRTPAWYARMREDAVPLLGSARAMAEAAEAAGLADVVATERTIDVGVDRAEQLVAYRLGQAPFSGWLDAIAPGQAEDVRLAAVAAVAPDMSPYRPRVVFLVARVSGAC
jgi:ubiquinone/menaquinone biosynthesis C-methylase UbiE